MRWASIKAIFNIVFEYLYACVSKDIILCLNLSILFILFRNKLDRLQSDN